MQFHSTYLQRRQPGVSYREFQRLWRSHGDFAATVPEFWRNVDRYIQNDPVEDMSGLPNLASSYDAVGELYYTSFEAWTSMRDVMWNRVAPDEKRVFAGAPLSVRGKRSVYQTPQGPVKLFVFARTRRTVSLEASQKMLEAHAAETMGSQEFGSALAGFTITTAMRPPVELAMDSVPQTASSHDILFVYHFENEGTSRTALGSADYAIVQASENAFLDEGSRIAILCRAWILKGEVG